MVKNKTQVRNAPKRLKKFFFLDFNCDIFRILTCPKLFFWEAQIQFLGLKLVANCSSPFIVCFHKVSGQEIIAEGWAG